MKDSIELYQIIEVNKFIYLMIKYNDKNDKEKFLENIENNQNKNLLNQNDNSTNSDLKLENEKYGMIIAHSLYFSVHVVQYIQKLYKKYIQKILKLFNFYFLEVYQSFFLPYFILILKKKK